MLLAEFGIALGGYVIAIGDVVADLPALPPHQLWERAEASDVRCPDPGAAERIRSAIDSAREAGESLGGVFAIAATGVPVGLGSHVHWDQRLDARLVAAVMSIPAFKIFKDGKVVSDFVGVQPKEKIVEEIERVIK